MIDAAPGHDVSSDGIRVSARPLGDSVTFQTELLSAT
jgi:hypothetical protein